MFQSVNSVLERDNDLPSHLKRDAGTAWQSPASCRKQTLSVLEVVRKCT